ncbi:PREDICTED: kelch-like protein 12 isoform X1 [Acropora digitifera]|uniref:kelch-like protein 12 isoform X1 n=1 Tax=Acropora digitifera TaxID=70779 RepID=UPI00077AA016|nr:PREDICTED: kelch-like protein 12 isoform X1 [Acropora digitifera]XP_015769085.1 PREDICTED: kelch-like protein 12 isoform X1 [Acropora digitifera]
MVAHSEILLSKCAQFREQGEFIDVRLKVGEDEFEAHRIVLAASSDYFHAMFAHGMKESNQEVIELKDENISVAAIKIVIDSMYSGEINVNDENVFEVLIAADRLQVASVVEQCCKYLIQLRFDVQTYCRVIMLADQHSLKDLKEATERKMASMYKDICEQEEFLSDMNVDVLSALLCREDLKTPSENFVFKSVMQWIKYRKGERLDVGAKAIGAVRLGLVDSKDVIEELNTEEMKAIPEINMLLQEALIRNSRPSRSSALALEKGKPRSMNSVLVAILPNNDICYFNVQYKKWKPLSSVQKLPGNVQCYCTELIGNCLYVAATYDFGPIHQVFCYDIVNNVWRALQPIPDSVFIEIGSLCHFEDHLYVIFKSSAPYRFNLTTNQWQPIARSKAVCNLGQKTFCNKAASVYKSCLYVLYGQGQIINFITGTIHHSLSVLFRFDPKKNRWEQKASTKTSHFGSSLFVVDNNLCVAGGRCSLKTSLFAPYGYPAGDPAAVEVYNDQKDAWSVVKQTHISPNDLGAVEIDGRVYFIINSFPVDSGIRIPPGEVYPVVLDEWEDLKNVPENAVLCYVPLKTDNLTTENE